MRGKILHHHPLTLPTLQSPPPNFSPVKVHQQRVNNFTTHHTHDVMRLPLVCVLLQFDSSWEILQIQCLIGRRWGVAVTWHVHQPLGCQCTPVSYVFHIHNR